MEHVMTTSPRYVTIHRSVEVFAGAVVVCLWVVYLVVKTRIIDLNNTQHHHHRVVLKSHNVVVAADVRYFDIFIDRSE
jgi:hypothetical protein